ncbi:hypothetical protein [Bosea sp. (in: a-proteobacteria)]|uniref:hypothetical protein n=1 Tax=Bosea sp. (in: a-proteobacteria) TaxID=1871050 RepID=UPI001AC73623|nr:hypothetical protein [Bosea sp. (in: a-proteobacteria)]MBN9438240.1 hypothetical protein [Bosea sp. (in: a-proteobacteria)]
MSNDRLVAAVEAGAKAFYNEARQKRQFTWEHAGQNTRAEFRALVTPIVIAAVAAADAHDAAQTKAPPG